MKIWSVHGMPPEFPASSMMRTRVRVPPNGISSWHPCKLHALKLEKLDKLQSRGGWQLL